MLDSVVGALQRLQGVAEIVVRFGIIRVDRDRLLAMPGRFVMPAELLQRVADIVMGAGVAGL